jgi:hypothetical protein
MKHTSLLDCYKSDTTYLSDEAKTIVLDIITRIDMINQMAKADVLIYADSQIVVERRILGEVTRWLAMWDADYDHHEGVHTPSDTLPFYWMTFTSDVAMLTLKTKSEINNQ